MSDHLPITKEELEEMKTWLRIDSDKLFGLQTSVVPVPCKWLARCIAEIERLNKRIKIIQALTKELARALTPPTP